MYLGGIILNKGITVGIIFLLVGMCIIPSTVTAFEKELSTMTAVCQDMLTTPL